MKGVGVEIPMGVEFRAAQARQIIAAVPQSESRQTQEGRGLVRKCTAHVSILSTAQFSEARSRTHHPLFPRRGKRDQDAAAVARRAAKTPERIVRCASLQAEAPQSVQSKHPTRRRLTHSRMAVHSKRAPNCMAQTARQRLFDALAKPRKRGKRALYAPFQHANKCPRPLLQGVTGLPERSGQGCTA